MKILGEILALWLGTLLLVRLAVKLMEEWAFPSWVLASVPILFLFAPVLVCQLRGVDAGQYPLHLPAFSDRRSWGVALGYAGVAALVLIVPFTLAYHVVETQVYGEPFTGRLPREGLRLLPWYVLAVGIPEEFYYRGYVQTRLDELWPPTWRIAGATLGPGWLVTCLLFAFGHSIVVFQWWHFLIVLPSLVFGWMRARTGGVMAGALFHAFCDVLVAFLAAMYGGR
jgi:membrane protease YdiL (CAAX protease family)